MASFYIKNEIEIPLHDLKVLPDLPMFNSLILCQTILPPNLLHSKYTDPSQSLEQRCSTGEDFGPQKACGNIWRHFSCHDWESCYWSTVGRGQRYCWIPPMHRKSSQQRPIPIKDDRNFRLSANVMQHRAGHLVPEALNTWFFTH